MGYVKDGLSLVALKLLIRQPGPGDDGDDSMSTLDIELLDWMDEQGIEPGDSF